MNRNWSLSLAVCLCLAACGAPRVFQSATGSEPTASLQRIYLATHHPPEHFAVGSRVEVEDLSEARQTQLTFAAVDVSIPPGHEVGQIEWPRKGTGPANPQTDFAVIGTEFLEGPVALRRALDRDSKSRSSDDLFLFIHGYNNTAPDATYRTAQIVEDFEIPMPGIVFAWPSAGRAGGYLYDKDSILFARDDLADLLEELTRGNARNIVIMAHSMGSQLVMETMRQLKLEGKTNVLKRLDTVALMSPDIDLDLFRRQAAEIDPYLPDPFVVFINNNDRALRISSILSGRRGRVGANLSRDDVDDLPINVLDFSTVSGGDSMEHLVQVTSPEAVSILSKLANEGALNSSNFDRWMSLDELRPRVTDSLGDL